MRELYSCAGMYLLWLAKVVNVKTNTLVSVTIILKYVKMQKAENA